MTKTPDFTKVVQDMMASFPVDASAFQNAFKTQAAFAEKFSKVAIEAAEKSTEISAKWAKDALAKVRDGDRIRLDATAGTLEALVDPAEWAARTLATLAADQAEDNAHGLGRELFGGMRRTVRSAEEGAITWL